MVIIISFDWKEFHDVGVHLEGHSSGEAYQRSAVGQYYYSCYHCVKDYFENNHFPLGFQDRPHETLINCLKTFGNDDKVDLAEILSKLRGYHNPIIIKVLEINAKKQQKISIYY